MSTFSDYKLYKQYEPEYSEWKLKRDTQNAKRLEYLKKHPELNNKQDIQRAHALLRAIDIMDEYSQKRAEDMEVATETVVGYAMDAAAFIGMGAGFFLCKIKPVEDLILKILKPIGNALKKDFTKTEGSKAIAVQVAGLGFGVLLSMFAAIPLMAWAAKTEVSASRKGRFEAMDKELDNPNGFAVLTNEQIKEAQEIAKGINIEEKNGNKITRGFQDSWNTIKDMVTDSDEYLRQRAAFLQELEERDNRINDKMTPEEIEAAKRDKQLLTKIVEKIDIASQDYAENAELGTQTAVLSLGAFGGLLSLGLNKLLNFLNIKSAGKISSITNIVTGAAVIAGSIFAAQIQKYASRVGRYKVKQELMRNPEELIYVDDEKASKLENVEPKPQKKKSFFKFLAGLYKDNQEYHDYKKKQGKAEKRFYKATEQLELSEKQIKDAVTLQKNTFRTFNKIDENSQKYSESVEALGKAIMTPISLIFTTIGGIAAPLIAFGKKLPETKIEYANSYAKMFGIVLLSVAPSIIMNAFITKEQKKASRVADMMAIKELDDYKNFRA